MLQREKSDEEERRRQALLVSKSDKKKGKSSSGDTGQASRLRQRNRSCEARVHDGGGSETSEAGKEGIKNAEGGRKRYESWAGTLLRQISSSF